LWADVYRPADADAHPVLVQRTPYDKQGMPATVMAVDGGQDSPHETREDLCCPPGAAAHLHNRTVLGSAI
jgi:hypothetical protein